ncbi:Conserved_hypothetical protein [Hexamita inflata]|uniref:Uncharacterized protein n=1 Tax=Hexamita inflata TaxID=28002 RepID=A0ABP1M231_9EUKA
MEQLISNYKTTQHFQEQYEKAHLLLNPPTPPKSEIYDVVQQRTETLNQNFHWFVRLQSLIFVSDTLTKHADTNPQDDIGRAAQELLPRMIHLINEQRPNYNPNLQKLATLFAQKAECYLFQYQVEIIKYFFKQDQIQALVEMFQFATLSPASLQFLVQTLFNTQNQNKEKLLNVILTKLMQSEQFSFFVDVIPEINAQMPENEQFLNPIAAFLQNFMPQNPFKSTAQFMPNVENFEGEQTMMLLKEANNLIMSSGAKAEARSFQPQQNAQPDKQLIAENERLRQQIVEYQQTLMQLESQPNLVNQTVQQLQIEVAQTKHCFDQLMLKYNSSREREKQLLQKVEQANSQINQFKVLFEEANVRYEQMKRATQDELNRQKQGSGKDYYQEYLAVERELEKVRAEKQQLSDITKKLISKLNNK